MKDGVTYATQTKSKLAPLKILLLIKTSNNTAARKKHNL